MGSAFLTRIGGIACLCLFACDGGQRKPPPGDCPAAVPAFRLVLDARPSLPTGTQLKVTFGGAQHESYELGSSQDENQTVCCAAVPRGQEAGVRIACGADTISPRTPAAATTFDVSGGAVQLDAGAATTDAATDAATDASVGISPSADAGLADAAVMPAPLVLVCDLWTNGAADIAVVAPGFSPLNETLTAELSDEWEGCNALTTVAIERQLEHPEAGAR